MLGNQNRIIVLNVEAAVGSAHGVWGYSVVSRWMMVVIVRAVCCRIRTETLGGAWCPKERVSREAREYLQVDLGQLKVVTLVETQGRFGNGQVLAVTSQLAQLSFLPGSLNRVPASVGVKARMSRLSGHGR